MTQSAFRGSEIRKISNNCIIVNEAIFRSNVIDRIDKPIYTREYRPHSLNTCAVRIYVRNLSP